MSIGECFKEPTYIEVVHAALRRCRIALVRLDVVLGGGLK